MRVGLVERAMGGDQEAFASLAADSVDGCYRLAYRILRDPYRAQEASGRAPCRRADGRWPHVLL